MLTSEQQKLKRRKLRYAEYYNLQSLFDSLYVDSQKGKVFTNLVQIMSSDENIKLAYRTIKGNTGSETAGVDKRTIKDLAKLSEERFVSLIKKQFEKYKPRAVRRVEIPKPNGKTRPLGIPTIIDRVVQQCILQVLEPICEAKFYKHSYGFRPNRSTENAIARCNQLMQLANLHYVVDIDIKGFFDNVCNSKLIQQIWSMGIQDKKLLCIIREMLKAPIMLPNGNVEYPIKGTPQGGILSPLLSNIVLNELDWWIASQWELMPLKFSKSKIYYNKNGSENRGFQYKLLQKSNLKEVYIVRYADDFKLFCRNRKDAYKIYEATKEWLIKRLKLEVSTEKSKVIDLKQHYSDFLGFKMKVKNKGGKYIVRSFMSDKAKEKVKKELTKGIEDIQNPKNEQEQHKAIFRYNSIVVGIHNYYRYATCVNLDFSKIAFCIGKKIKNRLGKQGLTRIGTLEKGYIKECYGKSKQLRFLKGHPLVPVGYIRHKNPMAKKRSINRYTPDGRAEIHKALGINIGILLWLMKNPLIKRSIEYADNRISLYAAQYGRCAITGKILQSHEIHCHHKTPLSLGGTDKYSNLIIVDTFIHQAIHASKEETVKQFLNKLQLTDKQLQKLNKLRKQVNLQEISY